ncbi:hypothetical protein pb186bvf_003992 [Paramecium bursaria]
MGCVGTKKIQKQDSNIPIDQFITAQIVDDERVDADVASKMPVYNVTIDKHVQVPKLRSPIFNTIVQRRKIQQYD